MLSFSCMCGRKFEVPERLAADLTECPDCRRELRFVGALSLTAHGENGVNARLAVRKGPTGIGQQFILIGTQPIEIGKLPDKPICLPGTLVSRNHCRISRGGTGWRIEDAASTNGTFVTGVRVGAHELKSGDVLRIGEYELEYALGTSAPAKRLHSESDDGMYDVAEEEAAPPPRRVTSLATAAGTPPKAGPARPCPSCGKVLPSTAKICVDCGINIDTGRPLLTAQSVDENVLYENTQTAVRAISWLIPFGLYPLASEGFGTRKPYVIWAVAAITVVASLIFWVNSFSGPDGFNDTKNLMLWTGHEPTASEILLAYRFRGRGDPRAFEEKLGQLRGKVSDQRLVVAAYQQLAPDQQCFGQFHWWQLLTYALLHGGIMHLAGNMLFLLVFGSRVNALIGAAQTAALYPLLAVAAALAYMWAEASGSPMPMLGASGAIMGLAGMYFVLFPVHRVHMVIWLRLGLFTAFRLLMKIFAVRGFWVVLFYLTFDVIATILGSRDGVAHWAHLGGFITGAAVALILLLARQIDARGSDLLSVTLGRHAWALLGRPTRRTGLSLASAAAP